MNIGIQKVNRMAASVAHNPVAVFKFQRAIKSRWKISNAMAARKQRMNVPIHAMRIMPDNCRSRCDATAAAVSRAKTICSGMAGMQSVTASSATNVAYWSGGIALFRRWTPKVNPPLAKVANITHPLWRKNVLFCSGCAIGIGLVATSSAAIGLT